MDIVTLMWTLFPLQSFLLFWACLCHSGSGVCEAEEELQLPRNGHMELRKEGCVDITD